MTATTGRSRPRPTRQEAADAAFVAALCGVALSGLRSSYEGPLFLAVGIAGILLGLIVSHLVACLTRSVLALAVAAVAGYLLVGPLVIVRGQGLAAAAPTLPTLRAAADAAVGGWKQLLTTQPPVGDAEPLLAVPFVLGLASAVAGYCLARRTEQAAAVIAVPLAALAGVIALGTERPTQWAVTAVLFTAVLLLWTAVRDHRRLSATSGPRTHSRMLTALAVLALAAGCATAVEPWLPGAGGAGRSVAREHITPPLDLSAYPSPLVGFHKYTKDANQLWNQQLMTVTGLPAGFPVQIAVLDDYNGSVWGAVNAGQGDEFERVGASLAAAPGAPSGPAATVRITIDPAYADADDVSPWLPTAGSVTAVSFASGDPADLSGNLWYDPATSSGVVTSRLRAGDTIVLDTVLDQTALPADAQPYTGPSLTDGYSSLFAARAAVWDKGSSGIGPQLAAIATYLRESGAYSDGGPGETQYLPGHSIVRLTGFLNGPQPVGDDEQYAAAYALMAESLGIPARVVFGAIPEAGGVVRGRDIHAWIQVRLASGAWAGVPDSRFMPSTTKAPAPQPPHLAQNADAAVVPPPDALPPPATTAGGGGAGSTGTGHHGGTGGGALPAWLVLLLTVLGWIAAPVLCVALVLGCVQGLKLRRRHRRRTGGSPANRFAAGWLDLVDHARDLGWAVPAGITRQQQAGRLAGPGMAALARTADAAVYGPGDPSPEHASGYWRDLDAARRELSRRADRRRRIKAAFDIRTLVPGLPTGAVSGRGGRG
jgi:Transglutaminase-like superfamily